MPPTPRPRGRTLTESEIKAIVARVAQEMTAAASKPPKPLHEMSDLERDQYASEVWARSGIIPDRPNAGRTISRRAPK